MGNHEKLKHLTEEELSTLIDRYTSTDDKVADLIKEYQIDIPISQLRSILPLITHEDMTCPFCKDVNLTSRVPPRTEYSTEDDIPFCQNCSHKNVARCSCVNCQQKRNNKKLEISSLKRDAIVDKFSGPYQTQEAEEISLFDATYISAICRHSLDEELLFLKPFETSNPFLAPTFEYRSKIVKHLYHNGFIYISPHSSIDAFEFNPELTEPETYIPTLVSWEFLPSLSVAEKRTYLEQITNRIKNEEWTDEWKNSVPQLWKEISKFECIENLHYLLEQRDFDPPEIGPKTHVVFEELLNTFSTSQVFMLSWMAVRDTVDYIFKEGIKHYHGKNMFIGAIQRKAERATAERWIVKNSKRSYCRPQTVVGSTFFNVLLGLGEEAFDTVIINNKD